jgi:predicted nucleic acid-binding protein
MILIDSNVVIDMLDDDGEWKAWSTEAVAEAGADQELAIAPIVVAEVAPRAGSLERFLGGIEKFGVTVSDMSNEAAYSAGIAFNVYRQRRRAGVDSFRSIIADFLIGGQALVQDATIITRDPRFYRTYFPTVPLITPETTEP